MAAREQKTPFAVLSRSVAVVRGSRVPIAPIVVLVALILAIGSQESGFLSIDSFRSIAAESSVLLLLALGETLLILVGRIDLAIGALASLATVVLAVLLNWMGWLAIPATLALLLVAGLLQGIIHLAFRLPSFVSTIGGLFLFSGLALIVSDAKAVPLDFDVTVLGWLASNRTTLGIPNLTIIALLVLVLLAAAMRWLPFGRWIYAMGVNEPAAILAGVPARRVVLTLFAISGLMAGLAGLLLVADFNAGRPGLANVLLLPAITAVVVGGTAITGGSGGMFRTLVGVIILGVMNVGINIIGWPPEYQQLVYGGVLILAVALTTDRKKLAVVK